MASGEVASERALPHSALLGVSQDSKAALTHMMKKVHFFHQTILPRVSHADRDFTTMQLLIAQSPQFCLQNVICMACQD